MFQNRTEEDGAWYPSRQSDYKNSYEQSMLLLKDDMYRILEKIMITKTALHTEMLRIS